MTMKRNQNLYLIKKIVPYFKRHKKIFILDLFFALMTTICELVYPVLIKYIVDAVSLSPELLTLESIIFCAAVFLRQGQYNTAQEASQQAYVRSVFRKECV